MNTEQRNDYGFPVIDEKRERALKIAADARQRNRLPCRCDTCREKELLPAVIQITQRWQI